MINVSSSRLLAATRLIFFLCLTWAVAGGPARAQSWTSVEQLPAAPVADNGYVRPQGTATYAQGNVYAVGYFYGTVSFGPTTLSTAANEQAADMYVAKLSPTRQWLWAVQAGGAGADFAFDVVLNAAGEVYIAGGVGPNAALGTFTLNPTYTSGFVAKLSASGQWLWASVAGGTSIQSLALDASNNVLVAGGYSGATTVGGVALASYGSTDVFIAKLDASGSQWQWVVRAGGSGLDYAYQLGTDAAGNAYVLGEYGNTAQFGTLQLPVGNSNGFVTKVSPTGQFVYATRLSSVNNLSPEGLVVDGPGNVYVTGGFKGSTLTLGTIRLSNYNTSYSDGFVAQLNPAGAWQWGVAFGGNGDDAGNGLALDGSGNLYVTGALESPSVAFGSTTITSTTSSSELFVGRLGAGTGPRSWNWVVATGGYDDEAGVRLSAGPGNTLALVGTLSSLVVPFGSTTLSGTALSIYPDMFVTQLSAANGSWNWAVSSESGGDKRPFGTCADAQGNVYVAGSFIGTVTFGSTTLSSSTSGNDIFVAKRSPAGQWLWAARAGSDAADRATGIGVDAQGSVYITGYFGQGGFPVSVPAFSATFGSTTLTSAGRCDLFVAKLDAAGQWQWATRAGGLGDDKSFGDAPGAALAVSPAGEVFVTGLNSGTFTYGTPAQASAIGAGSFVAGLSTTGQWRWVQAVSPGASTLSTPQALAADAAGNVYLAGFFLGTRAFGSTSLVSAGSSDCFLARLDGSTGTYAWALRLGGTNSDGGNALALDAQGNPYLTGSLGSRMATVGSTALNNTGSGLFVARFTPAGQPTWVTVGSATSSGVVSALADATALTVDPAGLVYVAGHYQGNLALGSISLSSTPDANGLANRDLLVARLSPTGAWQYATQSAGGTYGEYATGIALGVGAQPYVAGYTYSRDVRFGSTPLRGYSTYATGFLVAPGAALLSVGPPAAPRLAAQLFPNPAGAQVPVLRLPPAGAAVLTVCDATGRLRLRRELPAATAEVSLPEAAAWPAGVYLLTVQQGAARQVLRLVRE